MRFLDEHRRRPASLADHLPCGRLGKEETSAEVHTHHLVEVSRIIIQKFAEQRDAGVGNRYIKPAEVPHRFVYQELQEVDIGNIAGNRDANAFRAVDDFCCICRKRFLQVIENDTGAEFGQLTADFKADSLASAGDDRHLVVEWFLWHIPIRMVALMRVAGDLAS